jgi:hypothetical protein
MNVSREIAFYEKTGETHIESFPINIPLTKLISILDVDIEDDPEVYKIYEINEKQFLELQKFVPELKRIDFENIDVFYECFEI